ncbi:MAG: hypothetical protein ABSH56_21735 [Bryobacteraceae bacterium]|jgi:ABC-type sugar transport system permease subunit
MASQGEVPDLIEAAVLFGQNMLDVVRQVAIFLLKQAIFATVVGAPPDEVSRRGIHR